MGKIMEAYVTPNDEQELYVIDHGDHISCYGYDNALDEIERIVIELVGRRVLPGSYLDNELTSVRAKRGTKEAWDTLQNLRDKLRSTVEAAGERAVCGLTPQLDGLEDHRVEVVDMHGEKRRFIVGRSTGWMPCHLEIKTRRSLGGEPAAREYKYVHDLGRVR